ncbi:alpha/beta hydrolase [Desulfosarcina widdelii]|uniref:Alpha/beta hydrolase n=1 Tax=Desulfosarcina widdelii TaxID=947919 RepID=A0A5K7Z542_9BACT|nr:alpha/beta hydrolase [Desulfosarcina widdelii]BBO74741.1 alpha/beta hydrolase [Desulfosarcina widdelii]
MKMIFSVFGLLLLALIGIYYLFNPETKDLNDVERKKLGGTYIRLSNGITHYKLEGPDNGELVVLVHGGTVPLWTWDKQIQPLKEQDYRILRYDMYGRGYSDRPNVVYDQQLYRAQLLELLDKLGLKKPFDLIGLSLGGGIATTFTAHHPERVRNLVLISPLINDFKVPFFVQIPIVREFITRLAGIKIITNRFISLFEGSPEAKKYLQLFTEQTTYKGFQRSLLSMLRNDAISGDYSPSYQSVGEQDRKVFLIWGNEDEEVTKTMIDRIKSLMPDLEFKPVEKAGHGVLFQKPYVINELITRCLK